MKTFRTKAIAALVVPAVVAIGAASASPASAASRGADQPCPVITDVRTVAAFDYAAGQEPESVNITPDGSLACGACPSTARRSASPQCPPASSSTD